MGLMHADEPDLLGLTCAVPRMRIRDGGSYGIYREDGVPSWSPRQRTGVPQISNRCAARFAPPSSLLAPSGHMGRPTSRQPPLRSSGAATAVGSSRPARASAESSSTSLNRVRLARSRAGRQIGFPEPGGGRRRSAARRPGDLLILFPDIQYSCMRPDRD